MNKAETEKKENRFVEYFREARAEMRKVTWPTREEALHLTGIVLAVTVAMAIFLALVDLFFTYVAGLIIG